MTRALLTTALLTSTAFVAAHQQREAARVVPAGTAQIAGTVMSGDPKPAPVRRAVVTLRNEAGTERLMAVTDDAGRFAFTNLAADRYSLQASKNSYVPMNFGSKRPGGSGTPVVVAGGQRATVAMTLLKGSVITGVVRDERGRPLPNVSVSALVYAVSFQTGARELQSVTIGSAGLAAQNYSPEAFPGTDMTDDRGAYRIYGLAPGEYVISASARPERGNPTLSTDVHQVTAADVQRAQQLLRGSRGGPTIDVRGAAAPPADSSRVDYAPVYHPAATAAADATTIALGPAEEKSGVDVLLRLVPTARVTGVATATDGTPLEGAQVSVMDPAYSHGRVLRTTRSNLDGEYAIAGVPPGRYQMQSSLYPDGLFGVSEVTVDGRDVSTSIVLAAGVTVSGRIVFDGATTAPASNTVRLYLSRHTFAIGGGGYQIEPDGRFVFRSVVPGTYRLMINGRPPAGWVLRSVMASGVDVSDVAFEIKPNENVDGIVLTLTDRPAEISGTLQTAAGQPAPEYGLVVFSADARFRVPRSRRTQHVRPDVDGRFIVRDLPAGDYLISAVTDLENGQWNDPALLAELAASSPIRISLAEGDRKVQDIRIGGR
jgi:protocatechuate 3,4-dioxygenase beta subunit